MSSSSWPRWRCRGRCSPRSCAGSSACEGRPLRRPDASGPWGGKSRGNNRAPRSTRRAKENRIGSWTEVQRLFPAEISRRTCPRVDRGSSEEQGFGCRPSPSGEYRLKAPEISARMDLGGVTVRHWLKRFNARGLQGLEEDVRTGRPSTYSAEQRSAVINTAL